MAYRNGYYPHTLSTRVGNITLKVPRFRDGSFSTELFARYQRSEQALVLALMEMVLNGVSTRKVTKITEELCGTEFSKSTVSDLCKRLAPIIAAWNSRPLHEQEYPFVMVDALYVKVREDGRVRSRGVKIAAGINQQGYRELLALRVDDTESEASWGAFFVELKQRGLRGVDLITSDNHGGLVKALKKHFQGVTWQRCQTHFMRNILDVTPKSLREEVKAQVRAIFEAAKPEDARALLEKTLAAFQDAAPKAMKVLEAGFDDAIVVLTFPPECRKRIRTTNIMERLNGELHRRERVVRIFPNRESVLRLFGALLMDMDEKWATQKKYIEIKHYQETKKEMKKEAGKIVSIR